MDDFEPLVRSGAVALVVGGVRGLGLACARALAARGDRVYITWRSSVERARSLEEEFPGRVHPLDLEDPFCIEQLVGLVKQREGRIDWVVNSVGDFASGTLESLASASLERLWRSNVLTAMQLVAAVREPLRASQGGLVFFGCAGLDGHRARSGAAAFAAAKSSLLLLMRSLAVEEAPYGVCLNMISPGLVPHDAAHGETLDKDLQARIPAGRAGSLAEVAAAVLYLTSDAAAHTTGADLPVAGGWLL